MNLDQPDTVESLRLQVQQLTYERRLLGECRRHLDEIADPEGRYTADAVRTAGELAQRIVDEIGHPVTDEPALGPSFREEIERLNGQLTRERHEHDSQIRQLGLMLLRLTKPQGGEHCCNVISNAWGHSPFCANLPPFLHPDDQSQIVNLSASSIATHYCAPSRTVEELAADVAGQPDWAKHEIDPYVSLPNSVSYGTDWPQEPPDPQCVCGAPWDSETNQCVMYAATRAAIVLEVDERDGPLFAAAGRAVLAIRNLPGLDPVARALIEAWDRREAIRTPAEQAYGVVTSAVADMIEQAWNIIANVGVFVHTNGWQAQHPSWVDAAKRWRDERYHPWLSHYCDTTPGAPRNVAWGRGRWIEEGRGHQWPDDAGESVQSQMVTSPPTPMIYFLVSASGLFRTYLDGGLAHRIARELDIVVVEVPITADYRKKTAGES